MKVFALILLLASIAMASTSTEQLVKRADCGRCKSMYDFCARHGHTEGQAGCKDTCRDRACDQNPGCREQCGGEFGKCPEMRRWHN